MLINALVPLDVSEVVADVLRCFALVDTALEKPDRTPVFNLGSWRGRFAAGGLTGSGKTLV